MSTSTLHSRSVGKLAMDGEGYYKPLMQMYASKQKSGTLSLVELGSHVDVYTVQLAEEGLVATCSGYGQQTTLLSFSEQGYSCAGPDNYCQ